MATHSPGTLWSTSNRSAKLQGPLRDVAVMTRGCVQYRRLLVNMLLWQHSIRGNIVRTARAEHEGVDTHAYVVPLRLDALPDEHAGAFDAVHEAGLRAYLVRCGQKGRDVEAHVRDARVKF